MAEGPKDGQNAEDPLTLLTKSQVVDGGQVEYNAPSTEKDPQTSSAASTSKTRTMCPPLKLFDFSLFFFSLFCCN